MGHLLNIPHSFKASPGAAIFGRDMLFDVPFIADWKQIGEFRQSMTDCNNEPKTRNVSITITKLAIKY
jgi:hypothetical protein